MKRWKCSVCGYIHEGEEPPEQCPICGADKSKFIEIEEGDSNDKVSADQQHAKRSSATTKRDVAAFITRFHVHPISVHIPNGVLPLSFFFNLAAIIFGSKNLEITAFYNMVIVVMALPFVIASGLIDWKIRYNGKITKVFTAKMICAALVLFFSSIVVGWRILNPMVLGPDSASRWTYIVIHLLSLIPAAVAGFFGGKLVFNEDVS